MNITVRQYQDSDYQGVVDLYKQGDLYGGQFDEDRDSQTRLSEITSQDPDSILLAEVNGEIVGTTSLIEDGRVAWLFRFAVIQCDTEKEIAQKLYDRAKDILKERGHNLVLVYTDDSDQRLKDRYRELGMIEGGNYTCFWADFEK